MTLYMEIKHNRNYTPDFDSIVLTLKDNTEMDIFWDEQDLEKKGEITTIHAKGVYIDGEEGDGRIDELRDNITDAVIPDCCDDSVRITDICFEDGAERFSLKL